MSTRFSFPYRMRSRSKSTSPNNSNADTIRDVHREILRQARRSFDLYAVGIVASTVLGITASGLVLANRLTEAGLTAVTGFGFITYSAQMNKDAQEKLTDLLERLEQISRSQ